MLGRQMACKRCLGELQQSWKQRPLHANLAIGSMAQYACQQQKGWRRHRDSGDAFEIGWQDRGDEWLSVSVSRAARLACLSAPKSPHHQAGLTSGTALQGLCLNGLCKALFLQCVNMTRLEWSWISYFLQCATRRCAGCFGLSIDCPLS